jgi:hypothetical protein
MPLENMQKVIEKLRDRITNHHDYLQNKEFRIRILLVDPLLRELGWDVENPDLVTLEDNPAESEQLSADYILKNGKKNIAIVEAKSPNKNIEDLKYRKKASDYADYAGVRFFMLTNGITWLLYERDVEKRLESLKPIVSFNIGRDKPYPCALNACSMWTLVTGRPLTDMGSVIDANSKTSSNTETDDDADRSSRDHSGSEGSRQLGLENKKTGTKHPIEEKNNKKAYYVACLEKLFEICGDEFKVNVLNNRKGHTHLYFSDDPNDPDFPDNPKSPDKKHSIQIGKTGIYMNGNGHIFTLGVTRRRTKQIADGLGYKVIGNLD